MLRNSEKLWQRRRMSAIVHEGNVLNPLWLAALPAGCSVMMRTAMTFVRATMIVMRMMRMPIITTHGGRWCRAACWKWRSPRVARGRRAACHASPGETQLNPHYGQIIFNHLELIFRNWWDGSKSRMNIGLK